jgi:hypothetical protein
MLREEDLVISRGRASHGGDFLHLRHEPTGITRHHAGPLTGVNVHKLLQEWHQQIEDEILSRGLTQFTVAAYQTKKTWQSPQ